MKSSRLEPLILVAAVIGTAVLGSQTPAIGFIGGVAILLALFAFDEGEGRSGTESIAFGGVTGFCIVPPLLFLASSILGATVPTGSAWTVPGLWLVATVIMFGVDRFRASSRDNVSLAGSGLGAGPTQPIVMQQPTTNYRPAPIRVEPVTPAAAYAPPPRSYMPPPAPVAPAPPATPVLVSHNFVEPTIVDAPAISRQPDVTAIPPGREALIYLNLVGEGLNVLRTVRAENLGRDYYRIADVMPEGEQWEFTPGQVVKCRKKALSNGKHMVAFEEAPRAQ